MLDVHPPHAPTHTWRDFLIHIATIVIGLLIAVGLEQTVEAIHHRIEVTEARKALQAEFDDNLLIYRVNFAGTRFIRQEMQDNLLILLFLRQHPGTPEEKLPGTLSWIERAEYANDAAWKTAQQSSVTAHMPRSEVASLNRAYSALGTVDLIEDQAWKAITLAARFFHADPDPSHLSSTQLDKEIDLTEACLEANFRWMVAMHDLNLVDERFTPAPTSAEMQEGMGKTRSPDELQKLAAAQNLTENQQRSSWDAVQLAERIRKAHARTPHE